MFIWTLLLRITHTIISQNIADSCWITLYIGLIFYYFIFLLIILINELTRNMFPVYVNEIYVAFHWKLGILSAMEQRHIYKHNWKLGLCEQSDIWIVTSSKWKHLSAIYLITSFLQRVTLLVLACKRTLSTPKVSLDVLSLRRTR
jgi:hypothetical protein